MTDQPSDPVCDLIPVPRDRLVEALRFVLMDLIRYRPQDRHDTFRRDIVQTLAAEKVMKHLETAGMAFYRQPPDPAALLGHRS